MEMISDYCYDNKCSHRLCVKGFYSLKSLFHFIFYTFEIDHHCIIDLYLHLGAVGSAIATPTDLVKVRFQAEGRLKSGQSPRYTTKNIDPHKVKPTLEGYLNISVTLFV